MYLAGRMNVANLPSNFKQVSDSLSWTVLNFRAPWEGSRGNTVSQQRATTGFPTTPEGISTSSFGPRSSSGLFSLAGEYVLDTELGPAEIMGNSAFGLYHLVRCEERKDLSTRDLQFTLRSKMCGSTAALALYKPLYKVRRLAMS